MTRIFTLMVAALVISACSVKQRPFIKDGNGAIQNVQTKTDNGLVQRIYLVGDAGVAGEGYSKEVFDYLKPMLDKESGDKASLVYLGDNIYPAGLPVEQSEDRTAAIRDLKPQLEVVRDFDGKTYFIPGNHDWNYSGRDGIDRVKAQESYVENYFSEKKKVRWYPNDGCADFKTVEFGDEAIMLFLDTEWWLQDWEKNGITNDDCKIDSRNEFVEELSKFFVKNRKKQILIMAHHPIYSNGEHGGKFGIKDHIFPLTNLNKALYIPLPFFGSAYPVTRAVAGPSQDISNPRYQDLIGEIEHILVWNKIKDAIFVGGHEHNLQYFNELSNHFVISGSGSKETYVSKSGSIEFAYSQRGFSRLSIYEDRSVYLEFFAEDPDGKFSMVYKKKIVQRALTPDEEFKEIYDDTQLPDSVTAVINPDYKAGPLKKLFLGQHYRDAWTQENTFPAIDLAHNKGGFDAIKKGGGLASTSIRLKQRTSEHEYALRSIDKNALNAFDEEIGKSFLGDIFQDQISSIHPFSATVVADLAEYANVYHTSPEVYYLKKQNALNIYNNYVNEGAYLLEERPDENWKDKKSFGGSENIIGYNTLLKKIAKSSKNEVDQRWTLRSRLYDIWIHDWDRHDDQWRWAEIENDTATVYRPIPRDRDQAFYKADGIVPWFTGAFVQKKFKNFKGNLKKAHWQSFNARFFDRHFLNEMDREDWLKEAKFLQENLTDEAIDQAFVNNWKALHATEYIDEVSEKLKKRRENLVPMVMELYDFLAKQVDVIGSKEKDKFVISYNDDKSVRVEGFSINKEGEVKRKYYDRTFLPKETKWINIYGLQSKDRFEFKGKNRNSIKIRVIGGKGKDIVTDESLSRASKSIFVYDLPDNMEIKAESKGLKDKRSNDFTKNLWDRYEFKYNNSNPLISFGFFRDDGFYFGGGITAITHSWKKEPYSTKHFFLFNYAPSTNAFQATYKGDFVQRIGSLDFSPELLVYRPFNVNYFGLDDAPKEFMDEYYRVRLDQFSAKPFIKKQWYDNRIKWLFGPTYAYQKALRNEGRITESDIFTPEDFEARNFLGFETRFEVDAVFKNKVRDFTGIRLDIGTQLATALESNIDEEFAKFYGSISSYFGFKLKKRSDLVLALKFGAGAIEGDVPFYNYLSVGADKVRGLNRNRFRGNGYLYQKIDVRYNIGYWENFFLPMEFGLLGGFDVGGINDPVADNMHYHTSWTAGFWINPLGYAVIHPYYSVSDDDQFFTLALGFSF